MRRRKGERPGDYLVTCDRSGIVFWSSDTVMTYNGLRVGRKYAFKRNPQEFLTPIKEEIGVPNPRPWQPAYLEDGMVYSDGNFIELTDVTYDEDGRIILK